MNRAMMRCAEIFFLLDHDGLLRSLEFIQLRRWRGGKGNSYLNKEYGKNEKKKKKKERRFLSFLGCESTVSYWYSTRALHIPGTPADQQGVKEGKGGKRSGAGSIKFFLFD